MSWELQGSLAIVVPRYGSEVLGGAETVIREIAERLAHRDLEVEVLTTCALDHATWDNYYEEGSTLVNGVKVHRFGTQKGDAKIQRGVGARISSGLQTTLFEQELWLNNGFRAPGLYRYLDIENDRFHTTLLSPYMFWTTYACAQIAPHKNILRPCLHDELFAYLDIYKPVFRTARGITFNSLPEVELARKIFELPDQVSVVGEGIDVPTDPDPKRFRSRYGIDEPFLIYAGRREWGKNVDTLISYFDSYLQEHDKPLKLVLMGKGEVQVPSHLKAKVIDLGFVDEQTKNDALAAASVTCQFSQWESFSRLLMESWAVDTPVVAFGGCAVTAYHTRSSQAGLVFNDYPEFAAALDVLLGDRQLAEALGANGRRYVSHYSWDRVIDQLIDRIETWGADQLRDLSHSTP